MELLEYIQILRKYQWMIILLLIVTLAAVYAANEFITPVYQAEATVLVKRNTMQMSFFDTQSLGKDQLFNYVEILKSRTTARTVIQRVLPYEELSPGAIDSMRRRVSISIVPQSDVVKISVTSVTPKEAQDIANAYVDVFIEDSQRANQTEARTAREFIEEQINIVRADLMDAEEKLLEFRKEVDTIRPTDETKALLEQVSKLEAEKAQMTINMSENKTKLESAYKRLQSQEETVISSTTITDNPILTEYKRKLTTLELQLASALEKYTEKHPEVIGLRAEIEQVKTKMAIEVERTVGAETITMNPIRQQLVLDIITWETAQAALTARQDALVKVIADLESALNVLPEKELQLARLMRDQSVAEKIYMILLENYEEIRIAEARETADIRLIDPAELPTKPIKPRKKLNLAIGGLLALFVGSGLALFIEYLDTTIKTAEDVEQILGLPVMGAIPNMNANMVRRRKRKRKITHDAGLPLGQ